MFFCIFGNVFGERIVPARVGLLHPVQPHGHRSDAQHRDVRIKAIAQTMLEVLAQVFAHCHHQIDDLARHRLA